MVDINPELLNNPTLGVAAQGQFLDVLDAQALENRYAEIEGREARVAYRHNNYPGFRPPSNFSSQWSDVAFSGESPAGPLEAAPGDDGTDTQRVTVRRSRGRSKAVSELSSAPDGDCE